MGRVVANKLLCLGIVIMVLSVLVVVLVLAQKLIGFQCI
jgi:hypothetical protein